MDQAVRRQVLDYHAGMLRDHHRVDTFHEAIHKVVKPGDVVVDLGSGTGVLSYYAAQAGASRVYAIEAGPIIWLAREVCAANGFQDRVTFLHNSSFHVELPERADVLISETLWNFGLGEGMIGFIADARERFLKPDARIIPADIRLNVMAVTQPHVHSRLADTTADRHGLKFDALRGYRLSNVYTPRVEPDEVLSRSQQILTIEVAEAATQDMNSEFELEIDRAGVMHGLAGWFRSRLADRVEVTNEPGLHTSWGHAYFPLERGVEVEPGDRISASVRSTGNGAHWHWRARVGRGDETLAATDQSTAFGFPMDRRAARADSAKPSLRPVSQILSHLLQRIDGQTDVPALIEDLEREFPDYFKRSGDADRFVRENLTQHAGV